MVENEEEGSSTIMRKKSRQNRVGGEDRGEGDGEGGRVHAPLRSTVRLSVPYVLDRTRRAPGTKGMDGSQITCISDSLVCGAQRLVFPGAVINYDRNRRMRARIVGHAGRRRRTSRAEPSFKAFLSLSLSLRSPVADGGLFIHSWPRRGETLLRVVAN